MGLMDIGYWIMTIGWVAVYGIALYALFRYNARLIPALAIAANFAFELQSAISHPNIGFLVGVVMDIFIFIAIFYLPSESIRSKIWTGIFFVLTLLITILADLWFSDGWQIVCFLIDVFMAVLFVLELYPAKTVPQYVRWAGVCRLVGDVGAWITCKENDVIVVFGFAAFAINVVYCVMTFRKPLAPPKRR